MARELRACLWWGGEKGEGESRGNEINDKLDPASQSHFLNVLCPKSYKSNIPFCPYWNHFCTAITSVSLGISRKMCFAFSFYIYSPACDRGRVKVRIQMGRTVTWRPGGVGRGCERRGLGPWPRAGPWESPLSWHRLNHPRSDLTYSEGSADSVLTP